MLCFYANYNENCTGIGQVTETMYQFITVNAMFHKIL